MEPEKTGNETNQTAGTRTQKKRIIGLLVAAGLVALGYGTMGLFVVQPMGAVPEGVTILYFRAGLNLPFISSADSLGMTDDGRLSPMERIGAMAGFWEVAEDRIITRLPYFERLYDISTDGRRWDF
jgi:hypothetical protein